MKLKEALKSHHDKYLEENPFAEATNSDAEDACQLFHLLEMYEEADSTFLLWLTETMKYELFCSFYQHLSNK